MPHDFSTILRTLEMLALELTRGTVNVWLANGQLYAISLSVKYAILYKIDISNWYLQE